MNLAVKHEARMTVREFLDWSATAPGRWQLVDGLPEAMAPAADIHAFIANEVGTILALHLRTAGRPCRVGQAGGVQPHARAHHNLRVPDVVVTCTPTNATSATIVNPVVLVEVLSPHNQAKTWANVWAYAAIPSVCEILGLRTAGVGGELLRRRPDATWPRDAEELGPTVMLESIGFAAPLAAFYATTHLAR